MMHDQSMLLLTPNAVMMHEHVTLSAQADGTGTQSVVALRGPQFTSS